MSNHEHIERIMNMLENSSIAGIDQADVEEKYQQFIDFCIPEKQAMYDAAKFFGANFEKKTVHRTVGTLKDKEWINIPMKVLSIFDTNSPSIMQKGLAGDETGTIVFTIWNAAGVELVEIGKNYLFGNVVVNTWNDNFQLSVNKNSSLEEVDMEINVKQRTFVLNGAVVGVQNGSGLITRCPECKRALYKGKCQEHGAISKSIPDTRLKLSLDDGHKVHDVIVGSDLTAKLTGLSTEEALDLATAELDSTIVAEKMTEKVFGRYMELECTPLSGTYVKAVALGA